MVQISILQMLNIAKVAGSKLGKNKKKSHWTFVGMSDRNKGT